MQLYPKKRVDIVTETALQGRICRAVAAAGAKGYTVSPASGNGARGMRQGDGVVEAAQRPITKGQRGLLPAVLAAVLLSAGRLFWLSVDSTSWSFAMSISSRGSEERHLPTYNFSNDCLMET